MADWTGNSNSIYKTLGASNHTDKERQNEDFYATEPKAGKLLLELETFSPTGSSVYLSNLHCIYLQ